MTDPQQAANDTSLGPTHGRHRAERTPVAAGSTVEFAGVAAETRHARWPWRWLRRSPGRWVAPCRDEARRRRVLLVVCTDDNRVALVMPPGEVVVLDPLQVRALRAALREAVFAIADPATEHPGPYALPITRQSA